MPTEYTEVELPASSRPTVPLKKVADPSDEYRAGAGVHRLVVPTEQFPLLNSSIDILVLVDEAHRSHANTLHANLLQALPHCRPSW